jgi:SOS-response transcriptional repressor LexA
MKYGGVYINRKMVAPRVLPTFDECWSKDMTKVQREVFLIVDEWWKEFGYSPSLRDIAYQRGKSSLANTMKIINRLCDIGVLKKQNGRGRTIRPVYINFKTLE